MTTQENSKGTLSMDILECKVCYSIPSTSSAIVLCQNGHVTCNQCKSRLNECGTCRKPFETKPVINILTQIWNSVQVVCKFKSAGCFEKPILNDRVTHEKDCEFRNVCKYVDGGCDKNISSKKELDEHEKRCEYRKILCYVSSCQSETNQTPMFLGPMATSLFAHESEFHSGRGEVRRVNIKNLANFNLSGRDVLDTTTYFDWKGKVYYIFVSNFGIDELSSSFKACLISTLPLKRADKLKCNLTLKHKGVKIMSHFGKVFSIDDTSRIHSMYTEGMIYPENLQENLKKGAITFNFRMCRDVRIESEEALM